MISLRKWQLSDATDLAHIMNNRRVQNNLRDGLPFPYTAADAEDFISGLMAAGDEPCRARAILLDGRVVGSISVSRMENVHRFTAEIGFCLAEEFWGRGIMSEAIGLFCTELFEETDIMRVFAAAYVHNTSSRRALEKAGFSLEGIMPCSAVKNSMVTDMALYGLTRARDEYPLRRLSAGEIPEALELAWKVFLEFEAPEYSEEGIQAFRAALDDDNRNRHMDFYGAFDGDRLVGMLAMRAPQHVSSFFVDPAYHRRGIGRRLFEAMRGEYELQEFTVNSSPYAVEVYRRLGFEATDEEQCEDGIRYTPMVLKEK